MLMREVMVAEERQGGGNGERAKGVGNKLTSQATWRFSSREKRRHHHHHCLLEARR